MSKTKLMKNSGIALALLIFPLNSHGQQNSAPLEATEALAPTDLAKRSVEIEKSLRTTLKQALWVKQEKLKTLFDKKDLNEKEIDERTLLQKDISEMRVFLSKTNPIVFKHAPKPLKNALDETENRNSKIASDALYDYQHAATRESAPEFSVCEKPLENPNTPPRKIYDKASNSYFLLGNCPTNRYSFDTATGTSTGTGTWTETDRVRNSLQEDYDTLIALCGDGGKFEDLDMQRNHEMEGAKIALKQFSDKSHPDYIDLMALKNAANKEGPKSDAAQTYQEVKKTFDELSAQAYGGQKEKPADCRINNANDAKKAYLTWKTKTPGCLADLQASCKQALSAANDKLSAFQKAHHVVSNKTELNPTSPQSSTRVHQGGKPTIRSTSHQSVSTETKIQDPIQSGADHAQ